MLQWVPVCPLPWSHALDQSTDSICQCPPPPQAINHFIEAGQSVKAIEAAIQARQFAKAAGIIDFLEPARAMPYFKRIAQVRRRHALA